MWKVFPRLGLFKLIFIVFSALFLSGLILAFPTGIEGGIFTWNHFGASLKVATPVTFLFLTIFYVFGKWGWLLFWKLPLLGKLLHKNVCPNLNGKWDGVICSSFTGDDGGPVSKEVTLDIKADLFGFDVCLTSNDGYQSSKVVQSEIHRDPRTNTFYISYLFEAGVPLPEATDDRVFDGAAKLEILIDDSGTSLRGSYWTNRAWQRGQNTAGILTASKPIKKAN